MVNIKNSEYEKYLTKLEADSQAYQKNAKRKQEDKTDFLSMNYEKYDNQYRRDQLKFQVRSSEIVIPNWGNDSDVSSDDLDEIIESFQDQREYLEELDPNKMTINQLINLIKNKDLKDHQTIPKDNQLVIKQDLGLDKFTQYSKMKLSELVKLYEGKKEDYQSLELDFYNLTVEMSLKGASYRDLKNEMHNDQSLLDLVRFAKANQADLDNLLLQSKKLCKQCDEVKMDLNQKRRKLSNIMYISLPVQENQEVSQEDNTLKLQIGVEQQLVIKESLQTNLKDNQHESKIEKLRADIVELQEKVDDIKFGQKNNLNIKDNLKKFVMSNLIKMDIILANMASVKIKMVRQTQIFENQQLEQVILNNARLNQDYKGKIQTMIQEIKQLKNQLQLANSLQQSIKESTGFKERLAKQLQIRQKEYENLENKQINDKRSSREQSITPSKGNKRSSSVSMMNIRSFQQHMTKVDDDNSLIEQTLQAKKKTCELIIRVRESKIEIQQAEEVMQIQKKLMQLYKDYMKHKSQQ